MRHATAAAAAWLVCITVFHMDKMLMEHERHRYRKISSAAAIEGT
jgi:hypothetical protein